jgi:hypothetical protein
MFATYGKDLTDMPVFKFILKSTADVQAQVDIVKGLKDAGYEVNAKDLSKKLGFRVFKTDNNTDKDNGVNDDSLKFQNLKAKFDAYGVAVRAGSITPQESDEEQFRKEAGLPPMSKEVDDAWFDDGGIRRPITLQSKTEIDQDIEQGATQ